MAIQKFDVFLSHHSDDKQAVETLARKLTDKGIKPWLDKWNLIPGQPWQQAVEEALEQCCTCIVFLGLSGTGPWQTEELRAAIDKRVRTADGSFRVVPVLLPGAKVTNGLPTFLAATTWVEFQENVEDDEDAFHRLLCGIKGLPPGKSVVSDQKRESARVEVAIRVKGTLEQFKLVADAAQEFLKTASQDATLTIKYLRSGSVIIVVECSPQGFRRLKSLFLSGQLANLMDSYVIEGIELSLPAPSVNQGRQSSVSEMNPDLLKLIELEKVDREIACLTDEVAAFPKRFAQIEEELAEDRANIEHAKAAIKNNEAARRKLEGEIQNLQQEIKYRKQSSSVTTNDPALMHEVEFAEEQISASEDKILELMVALEIEDKALKTADGQMKAGMLMLEGEKAKAEARTRAAERLMAALGERRSQLRSGVSVNALAHYDRVTRQRRSAVAEARGQKCLGCFVMIRPQTWEEIRTNAQIITCSSCGRILFFEPANDRPPEPGIGTKTTVSIDSPVTADEAAPFPYWKD